MMDKKHEVKLAAYDSLSKYKHFTYMAYLPLLVVTNTILMTVKAQERT